MFFPLYRRLAESHACSGVKLPHLHMADSCILRYCRELLSSTSTIIIVWDHSASLKVKKVIIILPLLYQCRYNCTYSVFFEADNRKALNLALRDQIAALEWVQANIGTFGGDKKKVGVMS